MGPKTIHLKWQKYCGNIICYLLLILSVSIPKVCKTMEDQEGEHPFLCMDLTYVSLLLEELGFPKSHVLKVIILNHFI